MCHYLMSVMMGVVLDGDVSSLQRLRVFFALASTIPEPVCLT